MKTLTLALTFAFALGTAASFAGNNPALTYPAGQFATTAGNIQVTPWAKAVLQYPGAIVVADASNGICPVMNHRISSKHSTVIGLSNGKHMTVCCPSCKQVVENNLGKYQAL